METVDEFRTKGAVGALRDAALDARDMAQEGGTALWTGIQSLTNAEAEGPAYLRCQDLPLRLSTAPLDFLDGRRFEATVLEVDGVSDPPRAKVMVPGMAEPLLVEILAPDAELPRPDGTSNGGSIIATLKDEWHATVQDFREKGAVAALKYAALDAVDLVGTGATTAVNGARSIAKPLIEPLIDLGSSAGPDSASSEAQNPAMQLLEGIKQELKSTVQDFREKGAVGTFKDAAMDAVDLVGSTASIAVSGARSIAAPLLPDLWAESSAEQAGNSSSSTQPPAAPAAPAASSAPAASPAAFVAAAPAAAAAAASAAASNPVAAASHAPDTSCSSAPAVPESQVPDTPMPSGKQPEKKSIVSMRRSQFEKPKEEKASKKEDEELID